MFGICHILCVSIHLMLLFISMGHIPTTPPMLFQYISCYSLSRRKLQQGFRILVSIHLMLLFISKYGVCKTDNMEVSIHLMLLFIRQPGFSPGLSFHVSIHLMLLFICMAYRLTGQKTCFNTSHVTLYQINTKSQDALLKCFNTSHVTLYQKRVRTCKKLVSVSIHLMLLFIQVDVLQPIGNQCFNTSHVTLYQLKEKTYYQLRKFQYISCYSLSLVL